jgi:hypothetical protein
MVYGFSLDSVFNQYTTFDRISANCYRPSIRRHAMVSQSYATVPDTCRRGSYGMKSPTPKKGKAGWGVLRDVQEDTRHICS